MSEPAQSSPATQATAPETAQPASPSICPHLGLPDDNATACAYASPWNYCHHEQSPVPVPLEQQNTLCLTAAHVQCPLLQEVTAPAGQQPTWRATWQGMVAAFRRLVTGGRGVGLIAITLLVCGLLLLLEADRGHTGFAFSPTRTRPAPTPSPTAGSISPELRRVPARSHLTQPTATPPATATRPRPSASPTVPSPSPTPSPTPPPGATLPPATEPPPPEPPATVTVGPTRVRVLVSSIHLRTGPSRHYPSLGYLVAGETALLLEESVGDYWYRVETDDGAIGWVAASVVELLQ